MIQNEILENRISYKGYGEEQPVDTNDTQGGRANNRRTEFKVLRTNYKSGETAQGPGSESDK